MLPKAKMMRIIINDKKRQQEYRKRKKLPLIIFVSSSIFHFLMAVVLSYVAVKQPEMTFPFRAYDRTKSLDVLFLKEEEPLPRIEIKEKFKPVVTEKSKVTMKEKQQVVQKSVPEKVETKPAWEAALLNNRNKGGQGSAGSPGLKGTRGNPGDRPGMMSAGGIVNKDIITQSGGTGIRSERIYDNMVIPAGTGENFGAGGKDISGFQFGVNEKGRGTGRADIPGRGGSGGSRGLGEDGPGQGLATGTGKGAGGKGTGIGLGDGSGTGGMGTGSGYGGTGSGSGKGGSGPGGPGSTGIDLNSPRSNPNLLVRTASANDNIKESPRKASTIDDKRSAIEKEGFKADLGKDMSSGKSTVVEKTPERNYGDALQDEINRDIHALRKLYEDWQNAKLPNIPKTLQITVVLDSSSSGPKVSSIDFHDASLNARVKDDLTKRIRSWQFKSLSDGINDPTSWPVKLSGRISWQ